MANSNNAQISFTINMNRENQIINQNININGDFLRNNDNFQQSNLNLYIKFFLFVFGLNGKNIFQIFVKIGFKYSVFIWLSASFFLKSDFYIIIIPFLARDFIILTKLFKKILSLRELNLEKKSKVLDFIEITLLSISKLLIIFYENALRSFALLIFIPLVFYFFLIILRKKKTILFNFMIEIIFNVILLIQLFLILMKIDKFILWNWREIFMVSWIFFYFQSILGISFLLFIIIKLLPYSQRNITNYRNEVKFNLWLAFVIICLMTSFYLFLEGICNYLVYDEKDLLKISLFFSSIGFMINIFVTLALKPSLENYINSYSGSRPPPVVRNNSEIKNEIISENNDLIIPKFLEKFSNTYFKKAIGKKVNEDKENKKNMKIIPKNLKKKEDKLKLSKQKGNLYLKTTKKSFSTNYLFNQNFSPSQNKIQMNFNNKQSDNNLDKIDEDLVEITDENRNNELKMSIPKIDFEENRNFFQSKPKSNLNSPTLKSPKISQNTPKLINNEHKENPENEINIIENKNSNSKKMIHIKSKSYLKKNPSENIFSLPNSNILQKEGEYFIRVIEEPINELNEEKESQIVKCHICYDKLSDAVIMDCGHGGICYDCALKIWKKKGICYLCREKIVQLLQIDINEKSGNFLKVISSTQLKIEVKEYDANEPLPEGARDNGDVIEIDSYHSITIDQNEIDRNEDAFIVRQENIQKHLR